jgi:hypothetical protein
MPSSEIISRNTMWWSNEVDRLEAQVASLRNDITTDVDTPEKLKAKWPTELPARE